MFSIWQVWFWWVRYLISSVSDQFGIWSVRYLISSISDNFVIWSALYPLNLVCNMFGICYLISRCLISRSMIIQYLKCLYLVSLVTLGVMTRRYQPCRWVMTERCHWQCCFSLAKSITSLSFESAAEWMTLLSFDLAGRIISLNLTYRCRWRCWPHAPAVSLAIRIGK
jgi:hypothetical protein